MGGKIEKSHGVRPPGPRGGAEAEGRREFSILPSIVKKSRYSAKKSEILSQIQATQPKITSLYV